MPCDDCSRAETCPPCVQENSDDVCACGHARSSHMGRPQGCARCGDFHTFQEPAEESFDYVATEKALEAPEGEGRPCTCSSRLEDEDGEVIHAEGCDALKEPWPCGDCGAMVPGDQEWCIAPDCQEKAKAMLRQLRGEAMVPRPEQPERRPPYAVAYVIGGVEPYEVLVPGDATVVAEDGVLKISHGEGPVLAIVRTMPVRLQERSADGTVDDDQ